MAISQSLMGNQLLIGTPEPDFIAGLENTDTILGAKGEDILVANEDLSMVNGNQGSDTINGNESDQMLRGGQNNDFIAANIGNDTILGDLGSDTLIGDPGDDLIFGAPFEDVDFAGDGQDYLYGGQGNDTLFGGAEDDLVFGNEDSDILHGNKGNDTIYGGQGKDTIYGGQENDQLFGDKGNDVLWGDLGVDSLNGGSGDDVFVIGRRNDVTGFLSTGGSTIDQATFIADFNDGLDLIALTGGLTFDDLDIFQGSGENVSNTIIQDKSTGEFLANLQGIDFTSLSKADFTYSTVRINNYLSFDRPTYTIAEDGTPQLSVNINRTGGIDEAVGATLFSTDGTATSPTDYDNTPITVNFAPGETSQTVGIPIVSDDIIEGEETFDLSLGFPFNGATVGSPQTATVTITDNGDTVAAADAGTIEFSSPQFAVNENGTPIATVTLNRTGGDSGPVSTKILLNGGTAIGGAAPLAEPVDYDNEFITVEWEDGDTSPKTIDIPINNDTLIEGNETVNLTLCDCTGGATVGEQSTAVLTIVDNNGTPSALNPEIDLFVGGTAIPDENGNVDFGNVDIGDDLSKTFTIKNSSPTDLLRIKGWELPENYFLEGTIPGTIAPNSQAKFTVSVDTITAGNPQGEILIRTNDLDATPFVFDVSAAIEDDGDTTPPDRQGGEIELIANGMEISDDSLTPINFGEADVGETLSKSFTIRNSSDSETLTLSNFTLPNGFSLTGDFPDNIAPNGEETITVNVDTSSVGNPEGTLSFETSDSDESPFNFDLTATINQDDDDTPGEPGGDIGGEIEVLDNGVFPLTDGSEIPVNFGETEVGETLSKTFTIRNTSDNNPLTLSNLNLPNGFSLAGDFPDSIAPNGEETITVNVDTSSVGNPEGTLSFETSDSDESPFNFDLTAIINQDDDDTPGEPGGDIGGEIEVLDNGVFPLTDGSEIPVDFGEAEVGETLSKTFTIRNTSDNNPLTLSNLNLPNGFSLAGDFPDSIAPNGEETITVNVDTSGVGNPEGTLSFETSDSDESPFNFDLTAIINQDDDTPGEPGGETGAEVEVLDAGFEITDGNTSVYDLGIVDIDESLSRTFTIRNTSDSDELVLGDLTLPNGFNLAGDFPDTIAPNSEANFTINIDTTDQNNFQGTLSFATNDTDENPFDFVIGATVRDPSAPVEIIGSPGRDRIQGDDDGVDIISPGAGADIITWRNVPPQGITDEVIGFMPNRDKLQFAIANFGGISNINPVTVTQLLGDGTDISGNNLIIFEDSISFADRTEADLALAEQNGTSDFPAFFVYSIGEEKYLGYDPIVNNAGDATNIAKFDIAPTAESFSFFN
ncbi:choice-of-anchor D domain-containing protein [Aerosakkonemataceae cyanobacterium BLCC-F154]|uniref:Choice-of-anchor D domain-containing protein n=1 Tax=Floridaenema fluviatile BLCC-F154 TaxID=3153640 RepID=A0ABV4YFZ9_9CYAN